jgi:hypothetical protein
MYRIMILAIFLLAIQHVQSQTTCASAYDNSFNNSHIGTHYSPGPFTIPLNADINGRIEVASDVDYYKFYITTGGSITLTLRNLPANYNLNLVNSQGRSIVTSARTGTSSETINFTATANTEYFALVYPVNNKTFNAKFCYTLRVATGTATRVSAPVLDGGALYPNPVVSVLNLRLDNISNPAQIRVTNAMGAVVHQQNTNQIITPINLRNIPAGIYIIDVIDSDGNQLYRDKFIRQ